MSCALISFNNFLDFGNLLTSTPASFNFSNSFINCDTALSSIPALAFSISSLVINPNPISLSISPFSIVPFDFSLTIFNVYSILLPIL